MKRAYQAQVLQGKSCNILNLYDLFPQSSPVGGAGGSAGEGACGEGHDLVDLAAGDFDFDGWVQEVG